VEKRVGRWPLAGESGEMQRTMNELTEKLADYRVASEAEKHLAVPANEVQASNNVRVRSEAAEARRKLRDAVGRALDVVNDPNTPEEVSAEFLALMEDPEVKQILRDQRG
jgi:hypothetical protein